jgi:hypothetical protein
VLYFLPAPLPFADFLTVDFFFAAFVDDFLAAFFGLFLVTAFFSAAAFRLDLPMSVLAVLAVPVKAWPASDFAPSYPALPYRRFYPLGLGRHLAQRLQSSFSPYPVSQSWAGHSLTANRMNTPITSRNVRYVSPVIKNDDRK